VRGRQVTILLLGGTAIHRHSGRVHARGMIHAGVASPGLGHSIAAGSVEARVRRIGIGYGGKPLGRAADQQQNA